ncbi:helix-turn-helix transcriptional regulator [Pelistega suis]|uniref:WYL domain-containing protein n=1 Tax=Pelistega suis TaxID=1631957 RepID=A0A849P132_9BURK|nr:WYL domain-containing protein [Pelistega suis]NOL51090.1 WYL domain-containing protein [Pelistega suis]
MGKRQDNLETTLMTIEILRHIAKHRLTTCAEIRTHLLGLGIERSERTIQRHLEMLSEHFDIERDNRSKPYGYRWKYQSVGLNLPTMNEAESLLFLLAKKNLSPLLPQQVLQSMQPFFEQAHQKLHVDALDKPEKEWLNKVIVAPTSQPLLPPPIEEGVLETLSSALFHNRYVDIVYERADGRVLNYRVSPLALVQQGHLMYVVVVFDGYTDFRHLALHRFKQATLTSFGFHRPKNFNLKEYVDAGHFGYTSGHQIRLRFSTTPKQAVYFLESRLSEDQTVIQQESYFYRFQATVVDTSMLEDWLNSFGDEIWDIEKEEVLD